MDSLFLFRIGVVATVRTFVADCLMQNVGTMRSMDRSTTINHCKLNRCLLFCGHFRHVFGVGGPKSNLRKWLKNGLRAAMVLLTAIVAKYAGPRQGP